MLDYQINTSVFQTIEYCNFHKIGNENNITSCSFESELKNF